MVTNTYKYKLVNTTINVIDSLNKLGVPYSTALVLKLIDMSNIQDFYRDINNGVNLEDVWEKYDLPRII